MPRGAMLQCEVDVLALWNSGMVVPPWRFACMSIASICGWWSFDLTRDTLVGCGWTGVSFRWYCGVGGLVVGH